MENCGFDVGKQSSHFCIVDVGRRVLKEGRVRNKEKALKGAFGGMEPMRFVLEASGKSFWLADQLRRLGHQAVVVDPGRTKAIGAARIKHDRLDARVLAELGQADLLAAVDQPSQELRLSRMPVTVRAGLVRARAQLINAVRSVADSEGVGIPGAMAANFTVATEHVAADMPEAMRVALRPMLDAIDGLSSAIVECDQAIQATAASDPIMQLLQTCPGVGPISAAAFAQVIRDPKRFSSGRAVGAYLGLVPSLYASGKTYHQGSITKCGNRHARWLLCMAGNALLRTKRDTALKRWGEKLALRLGRKKAIVALARKLAAVLWAMWRDMRSFEARLTVQAV
jgi:transposase